MKNFTLFFLSSTGKNVKKLYLSRGKLVSIFCISIILFFFLLYIILDYISLKHQSFENLVLRTENNNLHRQLEQFKTRMSRIDKTLNRINNFATKLRIITQFNDPDRPHLAVGGPSSENDFNTDASERTLSRIYGPVSVEPDSGENSSSLTLIDQKLRILQHASTLQEQSLEQLQELLEDQRSLLRSLPSIKPVNGWVTSGFGYRISPFTGLKVFHEGIDFATSTDTIIIAPADGRVTFAGVKPGYGNTIFIDHGYGICTKYAHNSVHFVKAGDRVLRGQRIATVGNTGRSTGPHLHYEVNVNGFPRDPQSYILNE